MINAGIYKRLQGAGKMFRKISNDQWIISDAQVTPVDFPWSF